MTLELCPAEICSEIFSFTCLDSGYTGRSLSLVSRYINWTSRPFKFQSLAVIGYEQLVAFAEIIENTPDDFRRVRTIFISAHSRGIASDSKALPVDYARRYKAHAAVERILHTISPYVEVVHAFFIFARPFPLLPVKLPALAELTVHGPMDANTAVDENIYFSSLKHLHLTTFNDPSFILTQMIRITPLLTHLRFSAQDHSHIFVDRLREALEPSPTKFPPAFEKLYIHAPTAPNRKWMQGMDVTLYEHTISSLERLSQERSCLVLLPPLRLGLFRMITIQDAEKAWLQSNAGKTWW